MPKIGELVSSENELGANSEGDDYFQLCGAGLFIAQLVPVTAVVERLLCVPMLVLGVSTVQSVVTGNAIQATCVQPEQPYSSRCKQQYQIVVVCKAGRLKAHRLL